MKVFNNDDVAKMDKFEHLFFCCKCIRGFKTLNHFTRYRSNCDPVECWRCKVCGKKYKVFSNAVKHSFKSCVRKTRRHSDEEII